MTPHERSYDATQPLADGTIYFVTNSVTFKGAYDGKSGLAVAPARRSLSTCAKTARSAPAAKMRPMAVVVPFDPTVPSMFYRIDVGD